MGLMRLRDGAWTQFGTAHGLPNRDVRVMREDRAGALWMGTAGGGLCRVTDAGSNALQVQVFNRTNGLPSDHVWALHLDNDGVLWAGTERGLARLEARGQTWQVNALTSRQGLFSEEVNEILEDHLGNLWLSCDRGIYRVAKRELSEVAAGHSRRVHCVAFDDTDGMPSAETNGQVSQPAGCRTPDGRLWFPTTGGVVGIDPESVSGNRALGSTGHWPVPSGDPPDGTGKPFSPGDDARSGDSTLSVSVGGSPTGAGGSPAPPIPAKRYGSLAAESIGPPVAIERIVTGRETIFETAPGRPFPASAEFTLSPGRARLLEIHYTAPNFRAPERVRFRYRLHGLDEEWTDAGNRRAAVFAGLRPGRYEFEVMAANNRELWSAQPAVFRIHLRPYLYQTTWFWIVAGFSGAVLVGWLVRWRLAEIKRLNQLEAANALAQERERIARDMHDDLGAGLTRVALLGQRLARSDGGPQGKRDRVERLTAEASQLVDNLGELVWATDSKNDQLDDLLRFLREQAAIFLADAQLSARLDFPVAVPKSPVAGSLRRDILLAFKEGLHNAVRHARASEVAVTARVLETTGVPSSLELVIADNGVGFNPAADGTGGEAGSFAKSLTSGTGLAGMRTRLQRHQGALEIQTTPGKGTTLTLRVPLTSQP
jgi:signal transduction histidine kinase